MNIEEVNALADAGMGVDLDEEATALLAEEAIAARLNALGEQLQAKLKESVQWRTETGIEQEWQDAEDAYQGEDDLNKALKPATLNGPFTTAGTNRPGSAPRSKVFLNITGPYVDGAAARIADMILPNDDSAWEIKPTPVQDAVSQMMGAVEGAVHGGTEAKGFLAPASTPAPNNIEATSTLSQNAVIPNGINGLQEGSNVATLSAPTSTPPADADARAKAAAELATKEIEDWLVECQFHAEMRKVIEDSARLGTGCLKGPYPVARKAKRVLRGPNGVAVERYSKIAPASRRVSMWDVFPAKGCGESIQNGPYVWERDNVSARSLRDMMKEDELGYLPQQIQRVLEGSPDKTENVAAARGDRNQVASSGAYEIWYYYGMLEREELMAAGLEEGELPVGAVQIPAIVVMVDGIVIKAMLNPLDDGSFPFDFLPWKRRTGLPYGRGVGWQMLTPQRMLNAAARTMMENLGLGAGPQMVMNRGLVRPADGVWEITPRKLWYIIDNPQAPNANLKAQDVFSAFNVPSLTAEFMNVIQFSQKLAEDVTGLPQLMQGNQGAAPDTVGGMQILNNNASTVLRRIARSVDDNVTEPHIRRYYEYLMEYGENDAAKDDFQIDARGSTALVERELQNQAIVQMGPMVVNPAFGVNPSKWFAEMAKAQKLDPSKFMFTDEEIQQRASQPPPEDPRITAAKINAEARTQQVQAVQQTNQQRAQQQAETALSIAEKKIDADLNELVMKMSGESGMQTEQIKADLFKIVTQINAQAQAARGQPVDPAVAPQISPAGYEPYGQAPAGQAWEK